jgi:hypothetical protein
LERADLAPHSLPAQAAIRATTWDTARNAQAVEPSAGWEAQQVSAAVADLAPLFQPHGPAISISLAPEDLAKGAYEHILTHEAGLSGFTVAGASLEQLLSFVDQRLRLREAYGTFLGRNALLYRHFMPADPQLDVFYTERQRNTAFMEALVEGHASGTITALGSLHNARAYALRSS